MASAGNFITHIAALQLVESGSVKLDGSIATLLPELAELPIVDYQIDDPTTFVLRPREADITLRQMLTHSSGIPSDEHPLIQMWRKATATAPEAWPEGTHFLVQRLHMPLIFEPGQGWHFGHSVHWLQLLIERASGLEFMDYIQQHIFRRLGMKSSSYVPREDIVSRLLQAVQREEDGSLTPGPRGALSGLTCSISDIVRILRELVSPSPALLTSDLMALLFEPAFSAQSNALRMLRVNTDDFMAPAGLDRGQRLPPVNFSCCGGLVVVEELPLSKFQPGTVTWSGSPNIVWAAHREKGLVMFFATQLLPTDDSEVVSIMMEFFKGANTRYFMD